LWNVFMKYLYLCQPNSVQMIEKLLQERTSAVVRLLYDHDISPDAIGLEKTKKEIEGDYTIVVFSLSRISKKSPETTASEIGQKLLEAVQEIERFSVIKGFLNLHMKDSFWISFLNEQSGNASFGILEERAEAPILVEYSSPNTNKPLHLGHIRNNLLGFSVAQILKANGQNVVKLNLVNDRGIHISKSMLAYIKWGQGETPESSGMKSDHLIGKYYVLFDQYYKAEIQELVLKGCSQEEAEKKAPLILEAQELLRKWENKDEPVRELWHRMNNWAYKGFKETYENLGVDFDVTQYESDTYLQGKALVMEGLRRKFLEQKSDGSIWADLTADGLDEKLLLRSDGTSVYMTQDLGTAELRYNEFNPSRLIYVVGNEQNYHFDVLKKILVKTGHTWADRIYHLSYGMVELPEGRMKSREGTVVDADDLMEEMIRTAETTTRELGKLQDFSDEEASNLFRILGLGALKYFILKVDPKKNMLFDPKESIDFNGNTGPFIQYTYARIQSLLRKATHAGFNFKETTLNVEDIVAGQFLLSQEKEIIRLLYQFPSVVAQSGKAYDPSGIANYVYELVKEYNQFYQEIPVLKEEVQSKIITRLKISSFTGDVIRKAMNLLGIEVPSRM
jgi:arginyl-tRNA synthetase